MGLRVFSSGVVLPVAKVVASDAKPMLIAYPTFVGIIMAGYASEVPNACSRNRAGQVNSFGTRQATSIAVAGLSSNAIDGLGR